MESKRRVQNTGVIKQTVKALLRILAETGPYTYSEATQIMDEVVTEIGEDDCEVNMTAEVLKARKGAIPAETESEEHALISGSGRAHRNGGGQLGAKSWKYLFRSAQVQGHRY